MIVLVFQYFPLHILSFTNDSIDTYMHLKEFTPSLQTEPSAHGFDAQSLTLISQLGPGE